MEEAGDGHIDESLLHVLLGYNKHIWDTLRLIQAEKEICVGLGKALKCFGFVFFFALDWANPPSNFLDDLCLALNTAPKLVSSWCTQQMVPLFEAALSCLHAPSCWLSTSPALFSGCSRAKTGAAEYSGLMRV